MNDCLVGLEVFEGVVSFDSCSFENNKNNDALFMRLDLVTMIIAVCDHDLVHIEDSDGATLGMMCLATSRCYFQFNVYIYQSQ